MYSSTWALASKWMMFVRMLLETFLFAHALVLMYCTGFDWGGGIYFMDCNYVRLTSGGIWKTTPDEMLYVEFLV